MSAISVANHPRAQRHIMLARAWGGLLPFALVLSMSSSAGVPLADAALRALTFGVIGTLLARTVAVTVWRELVVAELEATRKRVEGDHAAALAAAQAHAAEAADGTHRADPPSAAPRTPHAGAAPRARP